MKSKRNSQKTRLAGFITALLVIAFQGLVYSQTPGMIIERATGAGSLVLDPNGDGYVSISSNGFSSDDQTESEISYSSFIFPGLEPNSDLNNAPNCGFTDFVDKGNKDPGRKFLSSANNWLFRLRMGSVSPNAKSYSVLIDTDGKFGNTGINADPQYSLNNPGFEIEIVLATKFGVFVYDVNTPNCTPVISYPGTTNYQKAIALTADCNDPDYFLDFFVNFNDLIGQFGINSSTLMRYAIVDNTAANKSTICNPSSASDIAGVGNCANLSACLTTIVNFQGYCAPNQTLCLARTSCPSILGTISNSATSVSGSSSESNGTVIRLYKNSVFTASTTVSGGSWSIAGLSPLLATDVIDVTALANGAYESLSDCNTQTITACGSVFAAPVITSTSGKNICGTGILGYEIKVYRPDMTLFTANPLLSAYMPVPTGGVWVWKCTGNTGGCNAGSGVDCINNGGYMVFQTDANGCRSFPAFACVAQGGGYTPLTSVTPTIIANSVVSGATTVAVNVGLNAGGFSQSGYVYLFLNGAYYTVSNLISSAGTVAVSCPALPGCSTLSAVFIQSGSGTTDHDCFSARSSSVSVAGGVTAAPQISGNFCTSSNITSVSGISSETNGTSVQLFVNNVSTGSPVTVNSGTWTVSGLNISSGGVIRATAIAPCKSVSALSASVQVTSQSSASSLSVTTSPIFEQGTSISGTGINGSIIQVYIDAYPLAGTATVSGGVWTLSGIASYELYPGGVITAASTTGTGCPSPLVTAGIVQCVIPTNTLAVAPANMAICTNSGVATLTISGTQSDIVYQVFLANGTTATGPSILGNGGNMTINTGTLSANTTLRVKAIKIPLAACSAFQTNTVALVFGAPSTTLGVSVSSNTICSGGVATITVANSQSSYNYQLRNATGNAAIGSSVAGTGSAITFTTGALSGNTSFNILSSGTGINTCSSTLATIATISVTASPTLSLINNIGTTTLTCNTPSLNFTAGGGTTYTWSPALGNNATVNITAPGTYSLLTTTNGCTASAVLAIAQATAAPALTLSASHASLCTGQSATLSIAGAASYTWMPGNANTTSIVVSPSTTTVYTVTGADGICIGTATFSLLMSPCIVVVNDFTNTVQNTPVSGNVATNDSGTNGASFSIINQPVGGTVTINSSTGQFTFTPSPTFTGVTTATYNLCNGSPITCSAGVITVTVYPTLIANPDQITTTPSVTATGTLVSNDAGVLPGGVYTVTVTPINPVTGSLTVNPSTGQYTFVPDPSFTGTTSTTYTICNTSVNPSVCATTSIFIQVGNTPVAVADFTTTIINTVVTGSAATNDSGVITALNPAFTISQPLSGTGTVAINPTTGVYSYTPATGFTGTTACTYTFCNTLSPPCSTAAITFSVYPAVVSNSDIVSTTPAVVKTGSLAVNDLGILLSGTMTASYQFTLTQPASTTGTFVVNPANGQYTFTPNPVFTGSAQTAYTVCNTSVNPSVCSSTTVIIYVYPVPAPVNDFTTTVSGGIVNGNAAANDSGTTSAVFSLVNQPAGGTLAINATTGVYSFTAANAFTGVTTATYNLCNGAATSCSTAVISITVHPLIVANPDVINTSPTSTVSGNLLGNDAGITTTLGATYSVTINPPASSTGSFVVNPATGQYTFTPNANFTGSVQTTYQVCNTAVSPQQCSTATITINVYPGPVPANDFTTTVINTPVIANAASNDSGTSGGTFSIIAQPTGGTIVMNSSTGQFTFTPSPTFTGVTTATYNLCNGAPVTCSSAVISVTVHPLLVANPDVINTSPTSTVSGNLLGNDAGITTTVGATYSVTINPPASSTGSFVVNPATGQYTFTPNSNFTGSVQTTYQVCNTAVSPQQCSTATITINVYPSPLPVNDFTNTVINTAVVANAASNDGGTSGGTFSIIAQPTGGTVVINSSTGQFTFTPSPTFTGVTTATYNLCNGAPVTCSSAVISVTVYPALIANPDQITTTPSVTTTGTLVSNDAGVIPGGVYTVTVTPINPVTGTLTVNPATGQYTFVPNPSFTGTTSTTYTICNTSVNPIICSTASIFIQVGNTPVAVADFTTTMINTVVTGSAATNDSGVIPALNPAFTISQPLSGTGTVSINPTTGVYSYTPATGFTGTTACTYTFCNTLSPPCSTAAITFSVYPAVVSNSDIVSTTPAVVKTGSLAVNDLGILLSGTMTASYQFTLTQPASTTGTFVVNPSNGQYTFTPNPVFTGSAQTTYTVCNTSVNPSVCSSTTVIIYVYPVPAPVNDFTTTVSGGIVNGNAAANDSGTTSAVFSLVNQPGGGTLTINASTGVYSFTAANAFTGVTTATYNLCNGAATSCSTAVISITVHPLIVANPDVINTSPTSTVSGNLLGNDAGITTTLGATYSVTINPPASSTGSFVVNPATGQYTFTPNASFTGSVQTTYQVCNTVLNPQQCSTATITINVYPGPVPANDFTTTVINTPVIANAASNDSGTSGGTFSIITQPTGGTIVMNSSTGQFTFTPSSTFTGVTTATYNLCNGAPLTCSSAVISVTVYPALVALDDLIQTSSSVTVNGSLLANDLGIVSGGTYSVTHSPVASGTGTLLVNPATGQYTFIPNPAFSGSLISTYTVCNNSVNPIICSTATITFIIGDFPIAVDDEAVTIMDTPVSGYVSTNDSNLSSAVFSFGTPGTGSITGNAATGQYTFTPASGFTGTTSVTYTLCNIVSPPCATAVIQFTVYPELKAINDQALTNINTPVSGSLTANDLGLIAGGDYSVAIAQPSAGAGSIILDASNGHYTFTPASAYTGTVVLTYTVYQRNPSQSSSANLTIVVGAKSTIGLSKVLSKTEYNSDGTLNQTYKVVIKNMGNQMLTDISISDNLSATYPSPSTFTIQSLLAANATSLSTISLNTGFTGIAGNTVMTMPMTSSLEVGQTDTIVFKVKVAPNGFTGSYNNSASVTAVGASTFVSDGSVNSLDPDPDGDGNPENNTSPTTFSFSIVKIGIAKAVSSVENAGNGCHNITFKFTIKNFGTAPIYNVAAFDNLDNTFGNAATYSVISGPLSIKNLLVPNPNFTGNGNNINMIAASSSLAAGATDTLLLKIKYCVTGPATFSNIAQASASSLPEGGFTGNDVSNNGLDPDPDNDNNPTGPGENEPTVFTPEGNFFVPQGFSPNNDGVNDVLVIRGIENFPGNEFSIINRWGNVVYKKKGYDNTWNGTSNAAMTYGSDQLPEGTYFYILDLGDGSKALKGYIYLNRSAR